VFRLGHVGEAGRQRAARPPVAHLPGRPAREHPRDLQPVVHADGRRRRGHRGAAERATLSLRADMARKKTTPGLISRPEVIAVLREIKDNREEDTPRLILADWLDDRGDPRGEFIRLDMQLAATGACDARHAEIRKQQEADWLGPLAAKA